MLNLDARNRVEGFLEQLVNVGASVTAGLRRLPRGVVRLRERGYETSACALHPLARGLGAYAE
jgi:hypothetical protein